MCGPCAGELDAAAELAEKTFECPACLRVSFHPSDLKYGYCGSCQDFTGEAGQGLDVTAQSEGSVWGPGEWRVITGKECTLGLAARPVYCDRGQVIVTLDAWGSLGASIDHADAFPRYYFSIDRALREIAAWMRRRGQLA